jgi:hypothetical protein
LEEAFHGEAVARILDLVAFEMGKGMMGDRLHQGQILRHEKPTKQRQSYENQPLLHFFFSYGGL